MYQWNGGWGGMVFAMLLNAAVWLVLTGLLIWAVGSLLTNRAPSTRQPDRGPSAMELLRRRYARGEIDELTKA